MVYYGHKRGAKAACVCPKIWRLVVAGLGWEGGGGGHRLKKNVKISNIHDMGSHTHVKTVVMRP